jgi:hypothetical protein
MPLEFEPPTQKSVFSAFSVPALEMLPPLINEEITRLIGALFGAHRHLEPFVSLLLMLLPL